MSLQRLLGRLDPHAVRRGRQFEEVVRWFLLHDPIFRDQVDHVWLWDEWRARRPGQWGVDTGIDLVAETHSGALWAIQAKAYDSSRSVTKRDIDSFLSASARPEFAHRLLVATTDLIGRNARSTIAAQDKPVTQVLLADLESSPVIWPDSPGLLSAPTPKRAVPRPHQEEAVKAVIAGFERCDRGRLEMACGTGKTLTSLFIAEAMGAQRVLVLVPSLSLLKQTLREWCANRTVPFEWLPVCSDETVAGLDQAVSSTAELGVPVTTDSTQISSFLRSGSGRRFVFSTYQSSPRIAEALGAARVPTFDLVIADEAHRCAGPVTSDFATVLDSAAVRAKKRLFMTATPRYFTGRVLKAAHEVDLEVASMDDESRFGPTLHRLPFSQAIRRNLLTDYQVVVVGVDDAAFRDLTREARLVTHGDGEVTDARTLASQLGLARAMATYDLRRVISFHGRVNAARRFASGMSRAAQTLPVESRPTGEMWCDSVSGSMSAGARDERLRHLRELRPNQRGLVANARCLSEGVDVPTLDGVAFIDPRRSEVDIVQAVGRAIRRAEDKSVGTIVIPVFIGPEEDPDVALRSSEFKPVWDVILALRSHDADLAEQLDHLRRQMAKGSGAGQLPNRIHLDLPVRLGADFARSVSVRLVEATTSSFEVGFAMVEAFVDREGHALVPVGHIEGEFRLGAWVNRLRTLHGRHLLSLDRVERLEALPGWTWAVHAERFEIGYRWLSQFVEREGHARVPRGHLEGGFQLGGWVSRRRNAFRKGSLSSDRIERLESLPGWTWDPQEAQFEEAFARLELFVATAGHAAVPQGWVEGGFRLGTWVNKRRSEYRRGLMPIARVQRFEALPGWTWEPRADRFEAGFAALQRFVTREGHARVPAGYIDPDGFRLGNWVGERRTQYRAGRMSAANVARLEPLPRWAWDAVSERYEDGLAALERFVASHGHANVPSAYVDDDGFKLGAWVTLRRTLHNDGRLSEARIAHLESLPGWTWTPKGDFFESGFRALKQYVEREGHTRVPQRWVEGDVQLGTWVSGRRLEQRQGRLSPERQKRLEAVPSWTWDSRDEQFEMAFSALQQFVKREGHAQVPGSHVEDGFRLGSWVNTRRSEYRNGRLASDRVRRLEELPGWRWEVLHEQFEIGFAALAKFVEREGHAVVPTSHVEEGFRLGSWVSAVRVRYQKGRVAPDRIARLEALPGWTWDALDARFEEGLASLERFAQREGHTRVPQEYRDGDLRLGSWVTRLRSARGRQRLTPERKARVEAIPAWTWNPRATQLDDGLAALNAFVAREGHSLVPQRHVEGSFRLGSWVANRRTDYQKGRLDADLVERLEQIPGWTWNVRSASFETQLSLLQQYAAREGHCRVPVGHVEAGVKLGVRVNSIRTAYKRGQLPEDRIVRLEAIPGWTWSART